VASAQLPNLDDLLKGAGNLPKTPAVGQSVGAPDEKTNAAGIKEALAVGTERAVKSLSQVDGYFGNQAVKILMPSSIQKVADVARMAGFQKQVDMVGQEEKKIRTNPIARTTDLLKTVFGK
jgi:hypothetical protein